MDYGRQLATTLQQRTAATNLTDITRHFGTIDIGEILARITCGLLRAAALETRPSGGRRPRRYLPRPRDRAEQPAVAGTLARHH
jgi:hypothetical protein